MRAEIAQIDSFSSHADKNALLKWIEQADPAVRIFVNHGEDQVTESFALEAAKLTGRPATAPYSGEVWDLVSNELVHKAVVVPVIRKQAQGDSGSRTDGHREYKTTESTARASSVYEELRKTGYELIDLIENSKGVANKDLQALTGEIAGLIEKYRG